MPHSLLVTGVSGQFGQRVLAHLLDTLAVPVERIAAASRQPQKLGGSRRSHPHWRHCDVSKAKELQP